MHKKNGPVQKGGPFSVNVGRRSERPKPRPKGRVHEGAQLHQGLHRVTRGRES